MNEIERAIQKGINYLAKNQEEDGGFLSLSSPNPHDFSLARKFHTLFPVALILSSLNKLPDGVGGKTIRKKAVQFLLTQKSPYWTFNYWQRDSREARKMPYPDDLDDTSCALAAIFEYDKKLINAKALTNILAVLTALEEKEGGPYRTWLVDERGGEEWKDIDLVVNCNVAYFLSLQEVSLKSINKFVEQAIETKKYHSRYYPSFYPIAYFISRFYKGKKKRELAECILSKREANYKWENPLFTALAVSSLLNLGFSSSDLEKSIEYILGEQGNGSWKPYALYPDPVISGKLYYCGSRALTTAFCIEALGKFSARSESVRKSRKAETDGDQKRMRKKIVAITDQRFSNLHSELTEKFLAVRKKILKGDKTNQVTLLPYYVQKSLGNNKPADENVLAELGAAGLYGWMAYTIYDDFFDGEGDPEVLSLANICLRELTSIYCDNFAKDEKFLRFFRNTMDRIDSANAWEVSNCRAQLTGSSLTIPDRLPEFGKLERLANRSIGHALGPVAVLYLDTGNIESPDVKNLMAFFENYIIARQLNDDAHDWEDDLKRGQLSPTVVAVLKRYVKSNVSKGSMELDLKKEIHPDTNSDDISKVKNNKKRKNNLNNAGVSIDIGVGVKELHPRTNFRENTIFPKKKNNNQYLIIEGIFENWYGARRIFWYEVIQEVCGKALFHIRKARKHLGDIVAVKNKAVFEGMLASVENSAKEALAEQKEMLEFLEEYR